MKPTPAWSDAVTMPKFARLQKNITVDVAVIGGGITGVTTAWLLKKSGASVALLERDRCGLAETGHTTAHLTYVTDTRLHELVHDFGEDHAEAAWDAGRAAVHRIAEIVQTEKIDCDFAWVPGYLHAPLEKKGGASIRESLQEDARLARDFHFDAAYIDSIPFLQVPGIRFADQALFHPQKYLAHLLRALPGAGCHVFEQTDGSQMEGEPPVINIGRHTVHARFVVIATHVPLQGAAGTVAAALFQSKLAPYTSYAVGARLPRGIVPQASFWDTGNPYYYLRIDRFPKFDYAILGGADHKTGQARDPEKHYARVEKRLLRLFPEARIDHRWSGQVIETSDGLPYIGSTAPFQFVGTGFAGNGMTYGTITAMMACDAFHGRRNPWFDLFDVRRKKLRAVWDYLKENKDYPYYLAKDLLTRPSTTALRSVKRGQGKIVLADGKKVAAYRDDKGKLSVKSAVCPHLGCTVRWNDTEKTWDCPCHGSRFQATGQVMAGPAESDLAAP